MHPQTSRAWPPLTSDPPQDGFAVANRCLLSSEYGRAPKEVRLWSVMRLPKLVRRLAGPFLSCQGENKSTIRRRGSRIETGRLTNEWPRPLLLVKRGMIR